MPSVRAPTFPSRNRPSGDLATASHLQWRDRAGFHTGLPCYAQMGTCKPEAPEWDNDCLTQTCLRLSAGFVCVKRGRGPGFVLHGVGVCREPDST